MASPPSTPSTTTSQSTQSQSQSAQDYDINVQAMYDDYILGGTASGNSGDNIGIDDFRAQLNITTVGQTTANLIASLNINPSSTAPPAPTTNTSTPTILTQESRAHALYRVIGFPVVATDMTFYNPGFDIIKQTGVVRKLTLSAKIAIASKVGSAFENLSQTREQYVSNVQQVFSVPQSVEAGVLSLTSGTYGNGAVNKRLFASPFVKTSSPFDNTVADQSYASSIANMFCLIGNQSWTLSQFQDANGLFPNPSAGANTVLNQHQHIILPFAVDPRIDFSIWTSYSASSNNLSKRVAVPFAPDASFLKTSSTTTAQPPLLEKIITDRFSQFNNTNNIGTANQDTIDFIQNFKTITATQIGGLSISQIYSGNVFGLSSQAAFADYIQRIQAMMKSLVNAMHIIHLARCKYYLLPLPSTSGPAGGSSVRDVPLNAGLTYPVVSADLDIAYNQSQVLLTQINASLASANATPDAGGTTTTQNKLTLDSTTSDSEGSLNTNTSNILIKKRNGILNKACVALQTVEMIMGEFSGLGLADILAIVGALYVMPQINLLGFLDDDAIARAEINLGYPSQALQSQRPSISTTMTSYVSIVNLFYLVMDQIFQDYLNTGALNITSPGVVI